MVGSSLRRPHRPNVKFASASLMLQCFESKDTEMNVHTGRATRAQ